MASNDDPQRVGDETATPSEESTELRVLNDHSSEIQQLISTGLETVISEASQAHLITLDERIKIMKKVDAALDFMTIIISRVKSDAQNLYVLLDILNKEAAYKDIVKKIRRSKLLLNLCGTVVHFEHIQTGLIALLYRFGPDLETTENTCS